jgi:hypothetical protein
MIALVYKICIQFCIYTSALESVVYEKNGTQETVITFDFLM